MLAAGGPMSIRLVSWNVNGLRAVSAKPEWRWFAENTCDVIGLQETRPCPNSSGPGGQPAGWEAHWASSVVKKGYSGVAVFSRIKPLAVHSRAAPAGMAGRRAHPASGI